MFHSNALVFTEKEVPIKEGKLHVFRPEYIDDLALWNSFRKGDERTLVIIFDRYVKLLYNYGMRVVSDSDLVKDSVQELFIEVWKNRQNLGETDSIKFYLYKSIRRKLIRVKSTQVNKAMVELRRDYIYETTPSIECDLIAEQTTVEKKQHVEQLLKSLSKRQREAIFLRYFEEMEYDKIADVMGLSKQAAYNLVNSAIASLRIGIRIGPALLLFFFFL